MAAYGIAGSNILPAGISAWRILAEDWVSLGDIRDGKITGTPMFNSNDRLMERPHGMLVEASAKLMSTGKTTALTFLDQLALVQYHDLTLINSAMTGGTYIYLPTSSHTKWRFVITGGHTQNRYIEILTKRYLPFVGSAPVFEDIFTTAAQTTATGDPVFFGYTPTPATIHSSHITNFYVRNAGETVWENPSSIESDPTLELELMTPKDDQNGAYRNNGLVKVTISLILQSTTRAGMILKLNDVAQSVSNDIRLDGADGTQFTFLDNMGFVPTFANEGNAESNQAIRVTGTGVIPLASLDAVFV